MLLYVLFLTRLFLVFCDNSNVVYYSEQKQNHNTAESYCSSINCTLLSYGRLIVESAEKCGMTGLAWVGKPSIKRVGDERACFSVNLDSADGSKTNQSNSFNCATTCEDEKYLYFGVMTDRCICFASFDESNETNRRACQETTFCPGNAANETCGTSCTLDDTECIKDVALYKKEPDDRYSTVEKLYMQHTNGKVKQAYANKGNRYPFFCHCCKGDSHQGIAPDIKCHLYGKESINTSKLREHVECPAKQEAIDVSLITEESTANSNIYNAHVSTKTQEITFASQTSGTGDTLSTSFWPKSNLTSEPTTETVKEYDELNLGFITAVGVGTLVLLLAVMIMASILCKRRLKKTQITEQPNSSYLSAYDYSDISPRPDNPPELQVNDEVTNDVYDHASHAMIRSEDTGNIYDHTSNLDGTYNTTMFKNAEEPTENVYDHNPNTSTVSNKVNTETEADYDTCDNVASMRNVHENI